jgi:HTH-type transcriptional regulator / antitoxin HipB
MIKNQKQASITKSKLAELRNAKIEFESKKTNFSSIENELSENALDSLIEDLENQIKTYESLVQGNFHCLKPKNIKDIPNILIAARLAQKMSQKDLAEILGIKEQQVQRYESLDFEGTSWERIVDFSTGLNLQFFFEKIIIINTGNPEDMFEYPTGYSELDIKCAEEKFKKRHSLIFE